MKPFQPLAFQRMNPAALHDLPAEILEMLAQRDGGGPAGEAREPASYYQQALNLAAIVAIIDPHGAIQSVNRKFCEISGYSEAELIGADHRLMRSGLHGRDYFRPIYQAMARGATWQGQICDRAKSGKHYWTDTTIVPHFDGEGRILSYSVIRFDITPQKQAEERLWKVTNIDSLTQLPNRKKFMEDLQEIIVSSTDRHFTVGIIDIDHFKDINDSLGHAAGDAMLKAIARRVRGAINPDDILARLGGDEFALVFLDCPDRDDKERRLARIYKALERGVLLGGQQRELGASIGIARFPSGGRTRSELLKHADIALYEAKAKGRHCVEYFSDGMQYEIRRRADQLSQFKRAIDHRELCVHYQPIVPLSADLPFKLEALLRWNHPELGQLNPGHFAEALADEQLAAQADAQVLDIVLADIQNWHRIGTRIGQVAVNTTTGDFRTPAYVDKIDAAIAQGRIAASELCVEITEGMVIGDEGSNSRRAIERLSRLGVSVAFDDFGTGFASLRHLRDLPVDVVKIDRSFINSLETDPADWAVVEGIIRLAHHLDKRVVAEGVENEVQAKILQDLKCDYIQGFLISSVVSQEDIIDRLNNIASPFCGPAYMPGHINNPSN